MQNEAETMKVLRGRQELCQPKNKDRLFCLSSGAPAPKFEKLQAHIFVWWSNRYNWVIWRACCNMKIVQNDRSFWLENKYSASSESVRLLTLFRVMHFSSQTWSTCFPFNLIACLCPIPLARLVKLVLSSLVRKTFQSFGTLVAGPLTMWLFDAPLRFFSIPLLNFNNVCLWKNLQLIHRTTVWCPFSKFSKALR